jgi:Rab5 GDP/GTP exchange factor
MSTVGNASARDNALPSETPSDLSPHPQESSKPRTGQSSESSTAAHGSLTHPTRLDSLKDSLDFPEGTTLPQGSQRPINSSEKTVGDGGLVEDPSTRMQHLSLTADSRTPPQAAPPKYLPQTPPPPPEKDVTYLDPTPKTPQTSRPVSRQLSDDGEYDEKDPQYVQQATENDFNAHKQAVPSEAVPDKDSQSEIQSIMDQFTGGRGTPGKDEIMSPRLELANPMSSPSSHFPPRRSSLEHLPPFVSSSIKQSEKELPSPPVPPKPNQTPLMNATRSDNPNSPPSLSGAPLPEPEPDLPFDFHRFLEQLRHKSADPVAKFLRSFLNEFGKKQWMVHEQVKIIGDFLTFIANKMALCDVWRDVSDAEFDNAKEGMEKLVMNRLYAQTFSPAIPPPPQPLRGKGRRKDLDKMLGPGRRGQHQEDVERDEILAQKVRIYGWVKEEHLDIPSVGQGGERFLKLAQQELLKIKGYRAPRDKVICVLNCCKVIVGLLKSSKSADTSADSFVPLLIYVVLQAHPEHLVSNIQYILRFRNQDKLGGEAGYYLSSLSGAIQFIETLDRTSLTVSDSEFERHVELAVSAIAEKNRESEKHALGHVVSEKSTLSEAEVTPRTSMDASRSSPGKKPGRATFDGTDGGLDDNDAVAGLLRSIQRPLSTIGRIFSDEGSVSHGRSGPASTPQPGSTPRLSPSLFQPPRSSGEQKRSGEQQREKDDEPRPDVRLDAQEAAARQASAEAAEARRIDRAEHRNVVE